MFRNYLAAALRNLARNRMMAALNIAGLAVGFAAALFIALFIHHETSFDRWIPGHETLYRVTPIITFADRRSEAQDTSLPDLASWLKLDYPSIGAVTRLAERTHIVRRGDREDSEDVLWVDPAFFFVFPMPLVAGDLQKALANPGSAVLTRRLARKYFGHDDVVGEEITLDREAPLRVTAVVEDLPSNTHLTGDLIAAGHTAFSPLARYDRVAWNGTNKSWSTHTYFRLAPTADPQAAIAALSRDMPDFVNRHMPDRGAHGKDDVRYELWPVASLHLSPGKYSMRPHGDSAVLVGASAIGLLVLLIAGINFINLTTARAARRLLEVAVRKTTGARLRDLLAQFVGEALLYVGAGIVLAVSVVLEILPRFSTVIQGSITLDVWGRPALLAGTTVGFLLIGTLIGAYPAFVLSRVSPATALRGGMAGAGVSGPVRQGLVILQFGVLVVLMLATLVIHRQTLYASNEALRLDKDQIVMVERACERSFKEAVASLPDVRSVACSYETLLLNPDTATVEVPGRPPTTIGYFAVDFGFFELFSLAPAAGRFFSPAFGSDLPPEGLRTEQWRESVVINETAAAFLGFASPTAAIGKSFDWAHPDFIDPVARTARMSPRHPAIIVGVVSDFPMGSVRTRIQPAAFFVEPSFFGILNIKLAGERIPETLAAIDGLWKQMGKDRPINRYFFEQAVDHLYQEIVRQAQMLGLFAGMAIFVAALGLFGLAAFTAERRTKEIGIRKAMGAGVGEILRLLLWQFARPVLWANLIAWPVAFFVMRRWLAGFAYHIDLAPWMFLAAGGAALFIALATVAGHSLLVARTRPVLALRYE